MGIFVFGSKGLEWQKALSILSHVVGVSMWNQQDLYAITNR